MKRTYDWTNVYLAITLFIAISALSLAIYGIVVSTNKENDFAKKNEYVIVTDKYTRLVYHKVGYTNTFLRKRTLCVTSLDGSETYKINVSSDLYDTYDIADTVKFETLR
jgi:glucose uptake protein GlcU